MKKSFYGLIISCLLSLIISACAASAPTACPGPEQVPEAAFTMIDGDSIINPVNESGGSPFPRGERISISLSPITDPGGLEIVMQTRANILYWKKIDILDANCEVIPGSELELEANDHGPTRVFTLEVINTDASTATLRLWKAGLANVHTTYYQVSPIPTDWLGKRVTLTWDVDGALINFFAAAAIFIFPLFKLKKA